MLRLILEGLALPLRLWLQPHAFASWVNVLAPDLPPNYSLLVALRHFQSAAVRRAVGGLLLRYLIAFLWVPLISLLAYWLIPHATWGQVGLGMTMAALLGLALTLALSLQSGLVGSMVFGIALGLVFGTATAINGALLSSASYATGMSVGQVVDRGLGNNMPVLGAAMGLTLSIIIGSYNIKGTVIGGTLLGTAAVVFFYFGSAPRVQANNVTAFLFCLVTVNHIFVYPLEWVIALFGWLIVRSDPTTARELWTFSPARWDEFVWLPLPGTVDLLVAFYQQDHALGSEAIQQTLHHPFQHGSARKALARLGNSPIG